MEVLIRNRTIRPSQNSSDANYSVELEETGPNDLIVVFIDHESRDFRAIYWTTGEMVGTTDVLYFKVEETSSGLRIMWQNHEIMIQML